MPLNAKRAALRFAHRTQCQVRGLTCGGVPLVASGVAWGLHPPERLAGAQPELIVEEPSELVDFVGALHQ